MSTLPFLDTNVLVYAFTPSDDKTETAERILLDGGVVSVQVLNEFTSVARTKFRMNWAEIGQAIQGTTIMCPNPIALTYDTYLEARRISERHGFSIWEGSIIASALGAGCTTMYTEDLQHGQHVEGLRIENPFLSAQAHEP